MNHSGLQRWFLTRSAHHGRLLVAALGSAVVLSAADNSLDFGAARPFSYEALVTRARQMAQQPYTAAAPVPTTIEHLDYHEWGRVRYRTGFALFGQTPDDCPATFFHLGVLFRRPVSMFHVVGESARPILFRPHYFEVPSDSPASSLEVPNAFAGFRLQETRTRPDWVSQDWIAFLGATYFRAIGSLNQYGASARGIMIDSGETSPEEFPAFTEFYIDNASGENQTAIVCALLDGPSITGAYRFVLHRTDEVVQDVEVSLFVRRDIKRLGIAPLTSMFWFGENHKKELADWRPEVHDSDGLLVCGKSGERIWRPLTAPQDVRTTTVMAGDVASFGIVQRDRDPEHYLDGVRYERRPNVLIYPRGDWGKGRVELIELPTTNEWQDNIVAYWRPSEPIKAGRSLHFAYRVCWTAGEPAPSEKAVCTATRVGRVSRGDTWPWRYRVAVDFSAGALWQPVKSSPSITPVVSSVNASIENVLVEHGPKEGQMRVIFDTSTLGTNDVVVQMHLESNGSIVSEAWSYRLEPSRDGLDSQVLSAAARGVNRPENSEDTTASAAGSGGAQRMRAGP